MLTGPGWQVATIARGDVLALIVLKHRGYARRVALRQSLMHPDARVLVGEWFGDAEGCGDVVAVYQNGREVLS